MNLKFASAMTGLVLALATVSTSGAVAFDARQAPKAQLVAKASAITPLSMQFFCARNRSQCAGGGAAQVTMTNDLMAVLKRVNTHVNRSIRPERDTADIWELNPTSGDCEDYALSKRAALIKAGVSAGSLRIAYTHTRRGEPHAVLVVRTSEGDYVLDNLSSSVKTLRASGYRIRTMSGANPTSWNAG